MSRAWLRAHAMFLTALALGTAIRATVAVAYRPALLFTDTNGYLRQAEVPGLSAVRPSGYSFFLRPFVLLMDRTSALETVQAVQHVIGLLLAVACYCFLRRRGLPAWGATLAVVPVLLDPLQLVLEHYVLSDVLFEALLVLACLALLWRHRPGFPEVVVAGLLVGLSPLMRGAGTFLLALFLVAVLCLRVGWAKVVAFLVAAVLPVAAYAVAFHHEYGKYATSEYGPRFLYARLAPIVDCHDPQLRLPVYERSLCPPQPIDRRWSTDYYMWGSAAPVRRVSPQYRLAPPAGMTQQQVVKDFDRRVLRSQPVGYTKAVLKDFVRGFAPARTYEVPGYPAYYWLFANHYWTFDTFIARGRMSPKRLQSVRYDPAAAGFMAAYGRRVYLAGPLAAALLVVAVAVTLGAGGARRSRSRVAVGLLAGACVLPLLTGAALSGFSWRYQLPQVPLLPVAATLGAAALVRDRTGDRSLPDRRPLQVPPPRVVTPMTGSVHR